VSNAGNPHTTAESSAINGSNQRFFVAASKLEDFHRRIVGKDFRGRLAEAFSEIFLIAANAKGFTSAGDYNCGNRIIGGSVMEQVVESIRYNIAEGISSLWSVERNSPDGANIFHK
jgi:hypothetical protein